MADEDMEIEELYVDHEVDLDYEYVAPRYFDFTREESPVEAREVERWFESAKSYPPSPFAAKLFLRDDSFLKTNDSSSHCEDLENTAMTLNSISDDGSKAYEVVQESTSGEMKSCRGTIGGMHEAMHNESIVEIPNHHAPSYKGLRICDYFSSQKLKTKSKNAVKSRNSTLMKPTASMLAKKNQPSQVTSSRFNMRPGQINERMMCTSGIEIQASKRQKLDGGRLFKAVEMKQPIDLVHKVPKKDGVTEKNPYPKLRITVPREPDLETAQRARRMRPQDSGKMDDTKVSVWKFRARPLNRKIFEAPRLPLSQKSTPRLPEFQLFRLKTAERAMQHVSAASSSSVHWNEPDKELCNTNSLSVVENGNKGAVSISTLDSWRLNESQAFNFKAHSLNRKILSSKGDMDVTRNTKYGTTVPEHTLHAGNTTLRDLPTELFSKLSLKCELQRNNGPCSRPVNLPQRLCLTAKGSKENIFSSRPDKHEVQKHFLRGSETIQPWQ
ncbi:hypothetical protein SAY87_024424 [Trapa incisa]|uniref:TPX2 central domain-containing protein n=1 Tax=Trapa incisa TaxID=236973 RepID=A0AAN7GCT7_9MYRT|nr:hypothetical protein SAY87_024424 [Trapa incisa]